MDILTILKKPFIIPSLLAGLIVSFRIAILFVQYVQKKIRHRRQEQAKARARALKGKSDQPPISSDKA
jgi:uncharacterized protein (DUF2062 family)